MFEVSRGRTGAPTPSPSSVSIVGRNINCRNKNGLFSRDSVWFALKSPVNIVLRRDKPPLRGDEICQWLHSAAGVFVFTVDPAEADALAASDPAVKAGKMIAERHPWLVAEGVLPNGFKVPVQ